MLKAQKATYVNASLAGWGNWLGSDFPGEEGGRCTQVQDPATTTGGHRHLGETSPVAFMLKTSHPSSPSLLKSCTCRDSNRLDGEARCPSNPHSGSEVIPDSQLFPWGWEGLGDLWVLPNWLPNTGLISCARVTPEGESGPLSSPEPPPFLAPSASVTGLLPAPDPLPVQPRLLNRQS